MGVETVSWQIGWCPRRSDQMDRFAVFGAAEVVEPFEAVVELMEALEVFEPMPLEL